MTAPLVFMMSMPMFVYQCVCLCVFVGCCLDIYVLLVSYFFAACMYFVFIVYSFLFFKFVSLVQRFLSTIIMLLFHMLCNSILQFPTIS